MSNLTPEEIAAIREQIARSDQDRALFKRWWEEAHTPPMNLSELPKEHIAWTAWRHRGRIVEMEVRREQ